MEGNVSLTVFLKDEIVARGRDDEIALAVRDLPPLECSSDLLAFDDDTGRQVDIDLRPRTAPSAKRRGRPALGVTAKEVTLLPRHWDWLSRQRGGASATLRKLVEAEMRKGRGERECRDAAYSFLTVKAGNLPLFEDAVREIYAGNRAGYDRLTQRWPTAIRDHGRALAFPS